MPLLLSGLQESVKGALSTAQLRIGNAARPLSALLNAHDGLLDATVTLSIVHSAHLSALAPDLSDTFSLLDATADAEWLTFTLGAHSLLTRRFPRDRYVSTMCRHLYRGSLCQFSGTEPSGQTTCDHTLTACIARLNTIFYGGSPGVSEGVFG